MRASFSTKLAMSRNVISLPLSSVILSAMVRHFLLESYGNLPMIIFKLPGFSILLI